jgi:hypothetical protein
MLTGLSRTQTNQGQTQSSSKALLNFRLINIVNKMIVGKKSSHLGIN